MRRRSPTYLEESGLRRYPIIAVCCIIVAALCPSPAVGATNVVVFNFQMTSETPDWAWLAKGLADRITVDLCHSPALSLIERDQMQHLAEKMQWTPEMAKTECHEAPVP